MSEMLATRGEGYAVLADLWCSPGDTDMDDAHARAGELLSDLARVAPEAEASLQLFLAERASEEDYVDLFELDPRCPLYVGYHSFDEPRTCANAGVSDRNAYMIEITGIYRHLGLALDGGEMPDYLPLMLEFLALTSASDDPVRLKLIKEYILPYLPPMRKRLESLKTLYTHLFDVTERVLRLDADA